MKKYSAFVSFISIMLVQTSMAQQASKTYQDLERNYNEQNFESCIKLTRDVETMARAQKDTLVANSFSYIAFAYDQLGEVNKAITWFERERNLRTELGMAGTDTYSTSLYNLAFLYLKAGNYAQADAMAGQLLANDKKVYGVQGEEYLESVKSISSVYMQLDKFNEAEKLLLSTIRQQEKKSLKQATLMNKLGDLYTLTNQFSKASAMLNDAMRIIEKNAEPTDAAYLDATINLGILHMSQGKYDQAEEEFDFVLATIDTENPAYANILNNQAIVYQNLGQLDKAEKTFHDIQTSDSLTLGPTHPDFALTLSNIGLVYADEGKYSAAEKALLRATAIQKMNDESKTVSYGRKLNNLAKVYRMSGQVEKSIPLHEQALAIFKKALGENSPEFATTSFNLGISNWQLGRKDVALKYLKSSAAIRASKLGKKHPKYVESMQKIGEFQWEQKQLKEARQTFGEVFANYYFQINSFFPVLTEEEKSKFYYTNIKPSFEKFNSFALTARQQDPTILGEVFNHQINTKAAIMYATEKVKQSIQSSNDTVLIRGFDRWQALKEQIAKLYSQSQSPATLDSMQQEADAIEKEITRRSATFTRQFTRQNVTWQDIQKKLKPGEAAVEIIRFKNYSPEKSGKFTDQTTYAFLIVTPTTTNQPDVIELGNGNDLEGKLLNYYRNNIKFTLDDTRSYKFFFENFANYLRENRITKIFLSRDGVYNQININTVKNPATSKFLIDEFTVSLITNTRELVEKRATKSKSQSSVLIGFPKFNMGTQAGEGGAAVTRGGNLSRAFRGGLVRALRGDQGIAVLPGTQIEINQISKLCPDPEMFMETLASEELIKQVISPMLLHVATHGYFLEDDESAINTEKSTTYFPSPLLKSGLILAGAEDFLRTGTPVNENGDDGILTAYEAMNLNLDDTELVVLSACETGLGVVKNGEGVYGLQRAFKMAGAKSMIMSLWSVDDAATQELMSLFYQERMKRDDIHEAFRAAQQKLKEKYPHPFYWGAFIMVGI